MNLAELQLTSTELIDSSFGVLPAALSTETKSGSAIVNKRGDTNFGGDTSIDRYSFVQMQIGRRAAGFVLHSLQTD